MTGQCEANDDDSRETGKHRVGKRTGYCSICFGDVGAASKVVPDGFSRDSKISSNSFSETRISQIRDKHLRSNVITPIRVEFLNLQGTSLSPLCAIHRTTSTFILESQKPSVILQPRDQVCRHEKRSVYDSMYLRALLHCIYQALRNILVYEVPRDTFPKFRCIKKEIRMKEISGVDKGTSSNTRDINKKKEGNVKKGNPKSRRCYPSPLCLRYITEQNCVDVHEIGNGAELRHSTGDNTRSSIVGSR